MVEHCLRQSHLQRLHLNVKCTTCTNLQRARRSRLTVAIAQADHEQHIGSDLRWPADFHQHYLKGKPIGAGSFGTVYLGINIHTGHQVAIKVLPKSRGKIGKERTLPKLVQEVAVLGVLQDCPNVAKLEGYFEQDEHVLLVTELCSGGDLQWVSEKYGALGEHVVALVAYEALKVIKACHERGIIHGDIKPANFLLKEKKESSIFAARTAAGAASQPWLKAVDFGCSQMMQGPMRIQKRTGTPMYMAPEIFERNYSSEADIWSLGVMLYQLFTSRFPFWQQSGCPVTHLEEMHAAILNADVKYNFGPWKQMSREGKDFIRNCLIHDFTSRMTVDQALGHTWLRNLVSAEGEQSGGPSHNNILPKTTTKAQAQQKQYVR